MSPEPKTNNATFGLWDKLFQVLQQVTHNDTNQMRQPLSSIRPLTGRKTLTMDSGPCGANDEALLAATAQNLRKLAKILPAPQQPRKAWQERHLRPILGATFCARERVSFHGLGGFPTFSTGATTAFSGQRRGASFWMSPQNQLRSNGGRSERIRGKTMKQAPPQTKLIGNFGPRQTHPGDYHALHRFVAASLLST